jgi:hypothetical protein
VVVCLQVLPSYFSLLGVYQDFLDAVVNKRWRRRFVPVVQQGKAGAARTYTLSPDYYTQVPDVCEGQGCV